MYAVIETGGKQYKVSEGDVLYIEKMDVQPDDEVTFDKVCMVSDDSGASIGAPYVSGASVMGKVLKLGRSKKIIVFKYKPKKGYSKKQGHRQDYTKVEITKIAQ